MRLIDVDRPEGSIHVARGLAKMSLILVWVLLGLTLFVIVIEAVAAGKGTVSGLQAGVSRRFWTYTMIACGLALVFFERYQRRRLEERVQALEAQTKS